MNFSMLHCADLGLKNLPYGDNPRKTTIYGLKLINSDEIRYIGQTTQPTKIRFREHFYAMRLGKDLPIYRWLRKHESEIEIVELKEDAIFNQDEILFIEKYKNEGHRLLNCNKGGDGQCGFHLSEESRKKISESLKGRPGTTLDRKYGPDVRERMSNSQKERARTHPNPRLGIKHSDEYKEKHSKILSVALNTPEYREKRRKIAKDIMSRQDVRERLSAATKKQMSSPESRSFISEKISKLHQNPEYQKRHSEGLRNRPPPDEEWKQKNSSGVAKSWQDPGIRKKRLDAQREAYDKRKKLKEVQL